MKKLALVLGLICVTNVALADGYYRHGHHGYYGGGNWVAPVLIGGVIGYEISRNNQPQQVIVQQPVYVQQVPAPAPYVVQYQNCTVWREIVNQNGTVTQTRTCSQ